MAAPTEVVLPRVAAQVGVGCWLRKPANLTCPAVCKSFAKLLGIHFSESTYSLAFQLKKRYGFIGTSCRPFSPNQAHARLRPEATSYRFRLSKRPVLVKNIFNCLFIETGHDLGRGKRVACRKRTKHEGGIFGSGTGRVLVS